MAKLKILIAEDDKVIGKLYQVALQDEVFDKRFVNNGQDAIGQYREWQPDIILLDIWMPIMNGFQALEKIRLHIKDTQTTIIMVSSSSERDDIASCARIGIQGYIVKPFSTKEIAREILRCHNKKKVSSTGMKVEYLNPFLLSTKHTIETMSRIPVTTGKLAKKETKTTYGDVTGIIGMASDGVSGNMVISFSKEVILQIVANMFMEPVKEIIDRDVVDAVGELTNIICGGAKARLAKFNLKFDLATPTMVVGKNVQLFYRSDAPIIIIPFATEYGDFIIEANLGARKKIGT